MLEWKEIIGLFEEKDAKIISHRPQQSFRCMQMMYDPETDNAGDILYLLETGRLFERNIDPSVSLILLTDGEDLSLPKCSNLLCIPKKKSEPGLKELNDAFARQAGMDRLLLNLQEMLVRQAETGELIETISAFFAEPVSLLDTGFRFIYKSRRYRPKLPTYDHSDEYLSIAAFSELWTEEGFEELLYAKEPFALRFSTDHVYYIPVIRKGIKIAYLIIYTSPANLKLGEYYFRDFSRLAGIISLHMSQSHFLSLNKGEYYNYYFLQLLDGSLDYPTLKERLLIYGDELREEIYLLQVTGRSRPYTINELQETADTLRKVFANSFYCFREGKLYYLISRHPFERITRAETEDWSVVLRNNDLKAAFAGPFRDPAKLKDYLPELELLLRALKAEETVISLEDDRLKAMLLHLSEEERRHFLYPPLLDLLEYDQRHHTELCSTLRSYLTDPRNISGICQQLHIHKNTLYKRLDRIRDILGCDLQNGETIAILETGIRILELDGVL